eukprot:TRINITY_DN2861_c0_g1_i1.p1 TRINITY_DN2861_c0_g1~~TRINITY_DN2861_c0_g1_i1.p1  ORF type:complete len:718 (-),score=350.64 TRINITY_DN2861_c0_g1_i1:136-2289(-)
MKLVQAASVMAALELASAATLDSNPLKKVVTLLSGMKEQVETEAKEDEEAYEKYQCWCKKNKDVKDEAVDAAQAKITELEAFLEESTGVEGTLKTEIGSLEGGIAEDQDSLQKATAMREEEAAQYVTEEKDAKEVIAALKQALEVLKKVQLLQKQGHKAGSQEVRTQLLQLQDVMQRGVGNGRYGARFSSVMQQDLWDFLGSYGTPSKGGLRGLSALAGSSKLVAGQPLEGAAAGAQSYNSRSGEIFGLLGQMKDEFESDLSKAMKEEHMALVAFQQLRAAKSAEITAAQEQKSQKEKSLADLQVRVAQAKEDVVTTRDALGADQQFLLDLADNCKESVDTYEVRSKMRSDEIKAIGEAIGILTTDDARDTFGKTMSFLQTDSVTDGHNSKAMSVSSAAKNKAITAAMQRILKSAKKHNNWVLASLAVHVRLDAFTKVKEAMDKMTAELKEQQKAEFEKKEFCEKELDETEDSLKVKSQEKSDLEATQLNLENNIEQLTTEIEALKSDYKDMQVAMKRAGEDRKGENAVFQQSISDQRATISILNKALARLKQFYQPALVQQEPESKPGQAVGAPPPKAKEYSKSGGAGGVLQIIQKIISEASSEEAAIIANEESAQKAYEAIVKDLNKGIEANEMAQTQKTQEVEEASGKKSETEAALLSNGEELTKMDHMLKARHVECDWLLQYFDVRQQARQEELDSIADAKAILSGANFGSDE